MSWMPALVTAGVGGAAAVTYALLARKKGLAKASKRGKKEPKAEAPPDRYAEVIAQLRALSAEKGGLTEAEYTAERSRLEAEAVALLKAGASSEEKRPEPRSEVPAGVVTQRRGGGQLIGALWGGGLVVLAMLAYQQVSQSAVAREDGRKPPPKAAAASKQEAPPADPVLQAALAHAQAAPNDLQAVNAAAHEALAAQSFGEAMTWTRKALELDGKHTESRVHQAVLFAVRGEAVSSLEKLNQLLVEAPDHSEALLYRGFIALQAKDRTLALASLKRYLAVTPLEETAPNARHVVEMLESHAAGAKPH